MFFEVEVVLQDTGMGVIFARQLLPLSFTLAMGATLGGAAIKPHVTSPRALLPDGSPRLDIFAFELCSREDTPLFKVGDIVLLEVGLPANPSFKRDA